jgi:hypothetical protein
VNGRGSQKQTAGCSRRRGRISVELDVAMGRQQARNEQAVHYYVGLARDPGRRALGSPEFWARSAKGLPCAGGGLRATASRLPGCMSHVARRAGSTRGSPWTGQAARAVTTLGRNAVCQCCAGCAGPPMAHGVKKGFPPASLEPLTLSVTTQSIQPAST